MSQFSFTCCYARMKLVSLIPFLYPEACLAFLGSKESSAMWLCCSIEGRGAGEAKQQERAGREGSLSCQLPALGKWSLEGPGTRAPPARGRWWRFLPASSIESTTEGRECCCLHRMAARKKPCAQVLATQVQGLPLLTSTFNAVFAGAHPSLAALSCQVRSSGSSSAMQHPPKVSPCLFFSL